MSGPYREHPSIPVPVISREALPPWLRGYLMRDQTIRAVVDMAIRNRWTEAQLMQQLVVVLANAKADMERELIRLMSNAPPAPLILGSIPGTIPGTAELRQET